QLLGLAADELLERRVQARDLDLGDLVLLLERVLGRVVLDLDVLGLAPTLPVDAEDRLLQLAHRRSPSPSPSRSSASSRVSRRRFSSSRRSLRAAASTASTMRARTGPLTSDSRSTTRTVLTSSLISTWAIAQVPVNAPAAAETAAEAAPTKGTWVMPSWV